VLINQILTVKGGDVAAAAPDDTVADVIDRLAQMKIGALPVVKDGQLKGIVSERDIVRRMASDGVGLMSKPVLDICTQDVITCDSRDGVSTVLARMTEGRFRHMPVMEGGKMVGIVSIGDIVKARLQEQASEAAAMREYITA